MPVAGTFRTAYLIASLGLLALPLVAAAEAPSSVDFERHVMGLFGRMGCNAGSCHGSFQGRGGFRLSLFGAAADKDYFAVTRDALGRRINPVEPERSLLLLKATGQVEHGGGRRFAVDSEPYRLLRDWLRAGARWEAGSGRVEQLTVEPAEVAFHRAGEAGRLSVRARFAGGDAEDITRFCDFRTNDDAVAEVTPDGRVRGLRAGDTAVVVSYRGHVFPVRVLVPVELPAGYPYPDVLATNAVDREVFAKLRRLNIVPSDRAGDAEFLRRLTIDTIGTLPEPDEVRAFLADPDPDKRAKKIDALLANPLHAALWATKFCDITGNDTNALEQPRDLQAKRSQMWHDWLRKRFAANVHYDEIVRGILCATSRDGLAPDAWIERTRELDDEARKGFHTAYADKPTLDLFWRRQANVPIEQWGEKVAAAFLGVRLECAQCHKHPYDRWTQADYRSFANVFSQVNVGISPEARQLVDAENAQRQKNATNKNQVARVREVFIGGKPRTLADPETKKPLPARALGGPEIDVARGEDARVGLWAWLREPDNPFFARAFVNRVWGHYFGVGLVDPVDNFSLANPPSNARLLDLLAEEFVAHDYDIRHIERLILTSRAYQLSSLTNDTNRLDRNNYSHAYLRPPMAEVVLDMLATAVGVSESFGADAPAGSRAVEVGASRVQNGNVAYAFRIFGRPPRTSACDCERAMEPALPQTLYRMTDQALLDKLPKGRLARLLKDEADDDLVLDELFLATLTRLPTDAERTAFARYRAGKKDRRTAFTDTLWALLNTREFILNH